MATPKESFEQMAVANTVNPPPRWPDFPIPDDVANRFPGFARGVSQWNEQVQEFFRQASVSKANF